VRSGKIVGSVRVAGGILSSRIFGLVREAAIAFVFGAGAHGDVFGAVMRGPNLLQNLLGEQTLSASFIPVYSRMVEEGRKEEAGRLAGAIFGLLMATAAGISLLGVAFARPIVALMAPGFLGDAALVAEGLASVDRFPLAVTAVRILFPMTGFLVLSAWALGVLNSHRRFFLPYFAPVVWNASIIAALVTGYFLLDGSSGGPVLDRILLIACWGALLGGLLQFLVQLPLVWRLLGGLRVSLSTRLAGVKETLRAIGPMLGARGAVQLSAYLDQLLASVLMAGAIIALRYGSLLYLLPFALFGASVAAAELPELSRRRDAPEPDLIVERTRRSLRQIAFLVVPTAIGYLAFGFLIVGLVYRRGNFDLEANWLVYLVLAAYSLGLLASSWSRLLQNLYYAHGNTRTPATTAAIRIVVAFGVGVALMLWLDRFGVGSVTKLAPQGGDLRLGAVGLALAGGLGAWVELALLRFRSKGRLPEFSLPWAPVARMVALALLALLPAGALWIFGSSLPTWLTAVVVVVGYAGVYLAVARWAAWPELDSWLGRVRSDGQKPD
jgi:putative peptidoglycan lipid II flippase